MANKKKVLTNDGDNQGSITAQGSCYLSLSQRMRMHRGQITMYCEKSQTC